MANYQSNYTGAQIDTAVAKINSLDLSEINAGITKINNIVYNATEINNKLALIDDINNELNVTQSPTNVYHIGELIIQRWHVTMDFCNVQTVNFPQAFPHGCIWIGIQGTQCGDSGTNGYWAYTSIQCKIVSSSQMRMFLNSSTNNATMSAMILAIGY